jgi:hypothetical protein
MNNSSSYSGGGASYALITDYFTIMLWRLSIAPKRWPERFHEVTCFVRNMQDKGVI